MVVSIIGCLIGIAAAGTIIGMRVVANNCNLHVANNVAVDAAIICLSSSTIAHQVAYVIPERHGCLEIDNGIAVLACWKERKSITGRILH